MTKKKTSKEAALDWAQKAYNKLKDKHEPKCGILHLAEVLIIFFLKDIEIKLSLLYIITYTAILQ